MSSGDERIDNLGRDESDSDESNFALRRRKLERSKAAGRTKQEGLKRVKESRRRVDEDDDEEDAKVETKRIQRKQSGSSEEDVYKRPKHEEKSEDQAEDPEEDDREHRRSGRGKKERRSRNRGEFIRDFIDSEASEDDDDYNDNRVNYDPDEVERVKQLYRPSRPNKDLVRPEIDEMDPENINRYYEDREREAEEEIDSQEGDPEFPTRNDPKIFSVRCKHGAEKEAVVSILRKAFDMRSKLGGLTICSASAVDKSPGCVFVEAFKEKAVRDICEGLIHLNKDVVKVIPTNEVRDIYKPDPTKNIRVEPNTFVRVKTGPYAGDLGLVEDVDAGKSALIIKLVPRLIGNQDNDGRHFDPNDNSRPQQKLFNPEEYPPKDVSVVDATNVKKIIYKYAGQTFQNGFVIKRFPLKSLNIDNVRPSYEEVGDFRKAEPDERKWSELMKRQSLANDPTRNLRSMVQKGDMVRVTTGDMVGLQGRAVEVLADSIQVDFEGQMGLTEVYEFPILSLEKIFTVGEQVEVINGRFIGKTGSIVSFDDKHAVFVSDDTHEQLPVFLTDIRRRTTGAIINHLTGSQRIGLEKYDLVSLNDGKTVGLVLALQADYITIMDVDNYVSSLNQNKVDKKLIRHSVTSNTRNETIQEKCVVRVLSGRHRGTTARVLKVHHSKVFLVDPNLREHYGVFVEDAENLNVLETPGYDNTRKLAMFNNQAKINREREEFYGAGGAQSNRPPNTRNNPLSTRIQLIGQTKRIIKGPYKGYEGIIQSITGDTVRFELSAERKVVKIPLDFLNVNNLEKETIANANMAQSRTPMFRNPNSGTFNFYNTGTPAYKPFQ